MACFFALTMGKSGVEFGGEKIGSEIDHAGELGMSMNKGAARAHHWAIFSLVIRTLGY